MTLNLSVELSASDSCFHLPLAASRRKIGKDQPSFAELRWPINRASICDRVNEMISREPFRDIKPFSVIADVNNDRRVDGTHRGRSVFRHTKRARDGDELVPQLQTHSDLINARWPDGGITDESQWQIFVSLVRGGKSRRTRRFVSRFQSSSIVQLRAVRRSQAGVTSAIISK